MEPTLLRIVTAGSVDDGKSTLLGRLLHDNNAISEDHLQAIRRECHGKVDLAFVTDGLQAEREQGITIDVAYRYFATPKRRFILADTPGHEQYTCNMVTGASLSELALILVDVRKGILSQTRRHAYVAWLLGIRNIVVVINKMDLLNYDERAYRDIERQFNILTHRLDGCHPHCIPISALLGENVVRQSVHMPWFSGRSLMEYLENVVVSGAGQSGAFRLPVEYVIRQDNSSRYYAGQIAAGSVRAGDDVMILPSGKITKVSSISTYDGDLDLAAMPMSVSVCLKEHVDVSRGDMLVSPTSPPVTAQRWRAKVVWMSKTPLAPGHPYIIKHTSQVVRAEIRSVISKIDLATFEEREVTGLRQNDIGVVEVETSRPVFADAYTSNIHTGSFIIIDPLSNETAGAGMLTESITQPAPRSMRSGSVQPGLTVWFTGLSSAGKSKLREAVHERLWAMGYRVESLDGDEVRRSLCKDLGFTREDRNENVRRLAFVADLLTKAGVIVLVSAISPYRDTRNEARGKIGAFIEVYVNAPLAVCEQRDVKGLYRRARLGQIEFFTGIADPYEPPLSAEVECRTDRETLAESADKVLASILAWMSEE